MAFFPAPTPHYTGDLGDVFHALSKEGREERALKSQAERAKLQQFLDEPSRMAAAEGTDTYLGANNPFDLSQRVQPYEAKTSRMNAGTASDRLQFEKDWEGDRSARGWANQGVDERRVSVAEADQKLREDYAPDKSAQEWANYGLNQQQNQSTDRHQRVMELIAGQNAAAGSKQAEAGLQESELRAMTNIAQYLPPEQQAILGKIMANKTMPGFGDAVQAEKENNPMYRALMDRQNGKGGAKGVRDQNAVNASAARAGVKDGDKLDAAANKEIIDQQNVERKQQALSKLWPEIQSTRKALHSGTETLPAYGESESADVPLTAKRRRDLAVKEQQLNDEFLKLTTPLPYGEDPQRGTPAVTNDLFPDVPVPTNAKPKAGAVNSKQKPQFRSTPPGLMPDIFTTNSY